MQSNADKDLSLTCGDRKERDIERYVKQLKETAEMKERTAKNLREKQLHTELGNEERRAKNLMEYEREILRYFSEVKMREDLREYFVKMESLTDDGDLFCVDREKRDVDDYVNQMKEIGETKERYTKNLNERLVEHKNDVVKGAMLSEERKAEDLTEYDSEIRKYFSEMKKKKYFRDHALKMYSSTECDDREKRDIEEYAKQMSRIAEMKERTAKVELDSEVWKEPTSAEDRKTKDLMEYERDIERYFSEMKKKDDLREYEEEIERHILIKIHLDLVRDYETEKATSNTEGETSEEDYSGTAASSSQKGMPEVGDDSFHGEIYPTVLITKLSNGYCVVDRTGESDNILLEPTETTSIASQESDIESSEYFIHQSFLKHKDSIFKIKRDMGRVVDDDIEGEYRIILEEIHDNKKEKGIQKKKVDVSVQREEIKIEEHENSRGESDASEDILKILMDTDLKDESLEKSYTSPKKHRLAKINFDLEFPPPLRPERKKHSLSVPNLHSNLETQEDTLDREKDSSKIIMKPPRRKRSLRTSSNTASSSSNSLIAYGNSSCSLSDVNSINLGNVNFVTMDKDDGNNEVSTHPTKTARKSSDVSFAAPAISEFITGPGNLIHLGKMQHQPSAGILESSVPSKRESDTYEMFVPKKAPHEGRKRSHTFTRGDKYMADVRDDIKIKKKSKSVTDLLRRTFSLKHVSKSENPPCLPNLFKRYKKKKKKSQLEQPQKMPVIPEEGQAMRRSDTIESFASIFMLDDYEDSNGSSFLEKCTSYFDHYVSGSVLFPESESLKRTQSNLETSLSNVSASENMPMKIQRLLRSTSCTVSSQNKKFLNEESTLSLDPEAIKRAHELLNKSLGSNSSPSPPSPVPPKRSRSKLSLDAAESTDKVSISANKSTDFAEAVSEHDKNYRKASIKSTESFKTIFSSIKVCQPNDSPVATSVFSSAGNEMFEADKTNEVKNVSQLLGDQRGTTIVWPESDSSSDLGNKVQMCLSEDNSHNNIPNAVNIPAAQHKQFEAKRVEELHDQFLASQNLTHKTHDIREAEDIHHKEALKHFIRKFSLDLESCGIRISPEPLSLSEDTNRTSDPCSCCQEKSCIKPRLDDKEKLENATLCSSALPVTNLALVHQEEQVSEFPDRDNKQESVCKIPDRSDKQEERRIEELKEHFRALQKITHKIHDIREVEDIRHEEAMKHFLRKYSCDLESCGISVSPTVYDSTDGKVRCDEVDSNVKTLLQIAESFSIPPEDLHKSSDPCSCCQEKSCIKPRLDDKNKLENATLSSSVLPVTNLALLLQEKQVSEFPDRDNKQESVCKIPDRSDKQEERRIEELKEHFLALQNITHKIHDIREVEDIHHEEAMKHFLRKYSCDLESCGIKISSALDDSIDGKVGFDETDSSAKNILKTAELSSTPPDDMTESSDPCSCCKEMVCVNTRTDDSNRLLEHVALSSSLPMTNSTVVKQEKQGTEILDINVRQEHQVSEVRGTADRELSFFEFSDIADSKEHLIREFNGRSDSLATVKNAKDFKFDGENIVNDCKARVLGAKLQKLADLYVKDIVEQSRKISGDYERCCSSYVSCHDFIQHNDIFRNSRNVGSWESPDGIDTKILGKNYEEDILKYQAQLCLNNSDQNEVKIGLLRENECDTAAILDNFNYDATYSNRSEPILNKLSDLHSKSISECSLKSSDSIEKDQLNLLTVNSSSFECNREAVSAHNAEISVGELKEELIDNKAVIKPCLSDQSENIRDSNLSRIMRILMDDGNEPKPTVVNSGYPIPQSCHENASSHQVNSRTAETKASSDEQYELYNIRRCASDANHRSHEEGDKDREILFDRIPLKKKLSTNKRILHAFNKRLFRKRNLHLSTFDSSPIKEAVPQHCHSNESAPSKEDRRVSLSAPSTPTIRRPLHAPYISILETAGKNGSKVIEVVSPISRRKFFISSVKDDYLLMSPLSKSEDNLSSKWEEQSDGSLTDEDSFQEMESVDMYPDVHVNSKLLQLRTDPVGSNMMSKNEYDDTSVFNDKLKHDFASENIKLAEVLCMTGANVKTCHPTLVDSSKEAMNHLEYSERAAENKAELLLKTNNDNEHEVTDSNGDYDLALNKKPETKITDAKENVADADQLLGRPSVRNYKTEYYIEICEPKTKTVCEIIEMETRYQRGKSSLDSLDVNKPDFTKSHLVRKMNFNKAGYKTDTWSSHLSQTESKTEAINETEIDPNKSEPKTRGLSENEIALNTVELKTQHLNVTETDLNAARPSNRQLSGNETDLNIAEPKTQDLYADKLAFNSDDPKTQDLSEGETAFNTSAPTVETLGDNEFTFKAVEPQTETLSDNEANFPADEEDYDSETRAVNDKPRNTVSDIDNVFIIRKIKEAEDVINGEKERHTSQHEDDKEDKYNVTENFSENLEGKVNLRNYNCIKEQCSLHCNCASSILDDSSGVRILTIHRKHAFSPDSPDSPDSVPHYITNFPEITLRTWLERQEGQDLRAPSSVVIPEWVQTATVYPPTDTSSPGPPHHHLERPSKDEAGTTLHTGKDLLSPLKEITSVSKDHTIRGEDEQTPQQDRCIEVYPETLRQRQRNMAPSPSKVDIKNWESATGGSDDDSKGGKKFLPSVKALRHQFENGRPSSRETSPPLCTHVSTMEATNKQGRTSSSSSTSSLTMSSLETSSGFGSLNSSQATVETSSTAASKVTTNDDIVEPIFRQFQPINDELKDLMSQPPSTAGWNPQILLKKLYYLPEVPKMQHHGTSYTNIEGYLEKLPSGRKKATFWNAWKRRYFAAKEGILYYYQSKETEKPNMKLPLMGGKVEIMDTNTISIDDGDKDVGSGSMLGIDDGKGHYVVVRCISRQEAERWKKALETHTVEDFSSQFVQPWPRPTNPTLLRDTIVIDIGSCSVRAGVLASQATLPQLFFPSVVTTNRESHNQIWGLEALTPEARTGACVAFPVRPSHKISKFSVDLNAVSGLLQKTFNDLKVDPKNYNIQMSVPRVLNPHTQAELLKILFDKFGVKAVNLTHQAILALYSYNATSGIVVDIGERIDVVPVTDGYIVDGGVSRVPYGGYRIMDHLRQFLFQRNLSLINEVDSYIIRQILETVCYCALHYNAEKQRCTMNPENFEKSADLTNFFPKAPQFEAFHNITLDFGRFQASEGLFNPDAWGLDHPGLHKLVHKAIQECSLDIRKEMSRSVFLAGGVSLLPGLNERLTVELDNLTPPAVRPKVHASPYRYHSAYIGACVLAESPAFIQSRITKEEWHKQGNSALRKWAL